MASSDVTAGNNILATEYNNLRADVLNTSSGHTHDGTDSRFIGRHIIKKNADELVDNSTTLQNDDDFSFSIAANEVWVGRLVLKMQDEAGAAVPGVKLAWSLPSGATFQTFTSLYNNGTNTISDVQAAIANDFYGVNKDWGTTEANDYLIVEFIIINSSTAGTVQLQWAQFTADTQGTIIAAESFMVAHRKD